MDDIGESKTSLGDLVNKNEESKKSEEKSADKKSDSKIADLENLVSELKQKIIRQAADLDNTIKRFEREKQDTIKYATSDLLKKLSVPLEQLFLATNIALPEDASDFSKNLYTGVDMTKKEFIKTLKEHGLERIYPQGQKFDPNFHQAISQELVENCESGTVTKVIQAGYVLHGRVIKHAIVVLAQ